MPKPFSYGPLIRAGVFAFIGLFALKGPFAVMNDEARYPHPGLPANYMNYVWGSALLVFAFCALLTWRVAMEAFPPKGTLYFPVKANITVIDALVSPVAFFLLLLLGLFPRMWVNPMGGFGLRDMDVQQLVIIPAMALALLLWRPMWSFTRGQPIIRFPAGPWLPWKQEFPVKPGFEWVEYWAGKPRMHVGWLLLAKLGELNIELEVAGVSTPQAQLDAYRAEWERKLDTGVVGDAAAQHAALHRPLVKPWHLMGAMFGMPGLVLMLFMLFGTNLRGGPELGMTVLFLFGTGGLTLWFVSRFVSMNVLAAVTAVLTLICGVGIVTGLARGKRHHFNERLTSVCEGRGLQSDEPGEGVRWFTFTGYQFEPGRDEQPETPPKYVACQRFSSSSVEKRGREDRTRSSVEVTVRQVTTGDVMLTKSLTGAEPAPFDEANPRSVSGKPPTREAIEAEILPAVAALP